jgi:hypothetical protein
MHDDLDQLEQLMTGLRTVGQAHDRAHQTSLLITALVSQFPMVVEVDGETWVSVDRTSYDRAIVVLNLDHAKLPDVILEQLPNKETYISAAQWAVAHNRWSIEMKSFS